ncbi:MAG: MBL fold metallo-hydrolase [Ignavibacteriae bacterium]|nr:MBL fold metallo-hydrolase [Ignavibacteriota bacterium]
MRIILLGSGTSQGVPIIGCTCDTCISQNTKDKRLRTSAYIEVNGLKILIDTSIDFRQQMLRSNVTDLDAILFTHHHVDHIFGLDDLRQINQKYNKFVDIFGNKMTLDEIKLTFRYALDEKLIRYMAVPLMNFNYLENLPFRVKEKDSSEKEFCEVIPIEVYHGRIKIFGYRIGNFAYITDCSFIPEKEFGKLHGLDVLVLNALRQAPHPTHFNVEQAVATAININAKKTYFTHITHDLLHDEVNKTLPVNIELGYDELELIIDD